MRYTDLILQVTAVVSAGVGSRENPIHVVNVPKRIGILRELWTLVRFLIIAFVVVSLVSSALISPMKTGSECTYIGHLIVQISSIHVIVVQ